MTATQMVAQIARATPPLCGEAEREIARALAEAGLQNEAGLRHVLTMNVLAKAQHEGHSALNIVREAIQPAVLCAEDLERIAVIVREVQHG